MDAKRGYVPEDERNFAPAAVETLRTASRHIGYLINEGYALKQAVTFVGNHFLLSERQRLALMRSLATEEQLAGRRGRQVRPDAAAGAEVWVDGFNTVITLEVMLSGSVLLSCMDGTVRDLAALRGTYRLIPETRDAAGMLFSALEAMRIRSAVILLDEPVSNSGRLKTLLTEIGEAYPFGLDIRILRDVDRTLFEKENVITTDSVILDRCAGWLNLAADCAERLSRRALRVWERAPASGEGHGCG